MDEDELEDILDVVGGFTKEYKSTPSVIIPKKEIKPVLSKVIPQKTAVITTPKKITGKIATTRNEEDTTEQDFQITGKARTSEIDTAGLEMKEQHLDNTATALKKRTRKTKRDILVEKAKGNHGELMGNKYTSSRTRKILVQLNKFIYPDLKNYQIMEFLLLQSIDQNQELLPPNFKDLI